jgi:hypothetical protein
VRVSAHSVRQRGVTGHAGSVLSATLGDKGPAPQVHRVVRRPEAGAAAR